MPGASIFFVGTLITLGCSSGDSSAKGNELLLRQVSLPVSVICSETTKIRSFTILLRECKTFDRSQYINAQSVRGPIFFPSVCDLIVNVHGNFIIPQRV